MKRFSLLLLFVVSLFISFGCCSHIITIENTKIDMVDHLKASTVALVVEKTPDVYHTYCGGVWINKFHILTAKHCVEDDNEKVNIGEKVEYQVYNDFEPSFPISGNEKSYLAEIVAYAADYGLDLAVLKTIHNVTHDIAPISAGTINGGMALHIVGHPSGLQYSYTGATVAGDNRIINVMGAKRHVVHITGLIFFGNSGGGAFNLGGNVIGIMSFMKKPFNGHGFLVHRDKIIDFLDKETIAYSLN